MKHKCRTIWNVVILCSMLFAAVSPAAAAPAPAAPAVPPAQTLFSGPIVSEPVLPADTTGMPPVSATFSTPSTKSIELKTNRPLPHPSAYTAPAGDAALQTEYPTSSMPSPVHNWEGINNLDGVYPPDTDGEVGKDHYIQMVNVHTAIYDKTGTLLFGPFAPNLLWPAGDTCRLQNDGDPVALYDQFANRWILSQFALPNYPNGPFYECIAVSKTNNPTNVPSDWYLYTFMVHSTKMDDYPKLSIWPDAYYMTDNQFASGSGNWAGAGVFAFDRAKMIAGQAATFQYFDLFTANSNYGGMLPADLDGSALPPAGAPGLFFEVDDNTMGMGADAMRIWKFHVDWMTPANSTFGVGSSAGVGGQPNATLPVASFDLLPCTVSGSRNCIPQPGTSQKLDVIGDRLMFRAVYRNFGDHDAVLLNHTVLADGADRAGIRWYEVRDLFGVPTIHQQGTYAPADGAYRWMGSLAFDHVGNIALGYSVSSSTIYPSIRYAGRLVSDPLGTLPQSEVSVIAGSGSQTGTGARWGDYSAMSIDPVDDCTFYYTQEYIQTTGTASWQTRVAAFKFPSCSIGPQGTLQGKVVKQSNPSQGIPGATVAATSSPTQTVTVTTGADGAFRTPLPVGTYSVKASAYAYLPATVSGVSVTEGMTTTLADIQLAAAPSYTVNGVVKDARTGWPLYAKIVVDGAPIDPVWTQPVTGAYSVNLLGGTQFALKATNFWGGYAESNIPIGPLTANLTQDISLQPDVQACTAPGYKMHAMLESFDQTTIPAGWTVQHLGGACDWSFNNPGGRANLTGGSGNFAVADSDACGSGTTMSTVLVSPKVDVSTLSQIMLSFKYDYNNLASTEVARTEVSADGGANWSTVANWGSTDMRGPATFTQDVTSLLAGSTQAQVRFTYTAPGWDWWWELDDVFLGKNDCAPQSGGLVVGSVKDVNTSQPLPGATVKDDGLASTQTVSTPLDPNVPDSFYTLFAPSGSRSLTASKPQYAASTANVTVPLSGTVGQDFALGAGILNYTPASMDVAVSSGLTTTRPVTLTNSGSYTITYTINEIDKGFLPFGPFEKPPYIVKPFRQQASTSLGGGVSNPPAGQAWNGGQLLASLTLDSPASPWGVAFNSQTGKLWIGDSWAPTGSTIQEFNTDGSFTRKEWAYDFSSQYGPADAAYNPHTGTLWVMGVRSDHENCIYEIAPESGPTGRKICPGFSTTQRGLAYDPTTDTYFAGSWTDQSIHRFTSDGKLLSSKYVGLNVSGLAYNASSQHLFVATNASTTRFFVLDVANNYAPLGEFQASGFSSYGGAGLDMDCAGNLWAIDQVGKKVYKLASGEVTTMCMPSDLNWVKESIATGKIGPGQQSLIQVTFDGRVDPGIYSGQLQFVNDTPYTVPNMPLKLTVQVSSASGKVTGTVSTPGLCDVNPAVLANQPVAIKSFDGTTWNLTTNSQGVYSQWIDQVHSPVTVTVNLPGYQPGSFTNVAVVGGSSVTKDFTLRSLQPCFSVAPPTLAVTITLGQNTTRPVKVNNGGAASGTFTTTENSLGFIPGMPTPGPTAAQTNLFSLAGPAVEKVTGPYTPGDVNLVIDDGTAENSIGLTAGGAFIWLNRFTPAASSYPFTLDSVSLLFPSTTPAGSAMELVIYEDADGNPANGATFKYSQNVTVQNNDGATWNVFNLTTPVQLNGPTGDVLIGVVNRGATAAGQYPASIDQSSTLQRRSWIGLYTGAVPDPPTLPADSQFGIIDDLGGATLAGNWMIRGTGTTGGGVPVNLDWLTETPTTSLVLADTFQWVTIGFDAGKVAVPGQYKAAVNFNTTDSLHKQIPVNVTMNVVASALWGQLQGTIDGTGRCDTGQAAAKDATLTATGTDGNPHIVTTDANGHYLIWLSSSLSPYTLVASKPGYVQASASGIVVNNGGAMTNAPTLVLRTNAPCVNSTPAGLSITLPWGATGNQNLGLTNTGAASSLFTITEQTGGFIPMAPTADNYLIVGTGGSNVTAIQNALTAMGATNVLVSTTTFNGMTVAQLLAYKAVIWTTSLGPTSTSLPNMQAYLDAGGKLLVFYNDIGYSWRNTATPNFFTTYFEGQYFADSGSLGALTGVDIMAGVNPNVSTDPYPDSFTLVGPDATGLFVAPDTHWAGWRVARNSYKAVIMGFLLNYAAPATTQNQIVQKATAWMGATDVPWLSETPTSGNLPATVGNATVVVGFNAGHASITQPGTYTAFLKVANQDSSNTPLTVPVTMTVLNSAAQGKLNGTVAGLLYCDGGPGIPLENASVHIRGGAGISMTLKTDAAGYYQRWLDSGTYTVTVSAANYAGLAVTDISVPTGATTTQNFNLRWLKACVNTNPTSLSATVALGANTTLPLNITNVGAAGTAFKITEIEGGFKPVKPEAGADVLIVNEVTADAAAMEAALTSLGYTYDEVSNTTYNGMTIPALLAYKAVLYAGVISSGAEQTQTIAYLDAGGNLLLASDDEGYFYSSSVFYSTYLEAQYGTDSGSKGTITGQDIMAGVNTSIASDPYPDNFTIIDSNAVGIFHNDAPNTNWAGLRIARNTYKAIYLAWNFQYTGGTADTATKQTVMSKALDWLAPAVDVPWLTETPTSGTLPANTGNQLINVTLDAAQVNQPGVYTAAVGVKTDDPVNPYRTVPVTMTVQVSPGMGKLKGTAYSLGACDINPAPLANATVSLTDGVFHLTTTTDASGYYQFWVNTTSPLTVTATAPAYQLDQAVVSVPASTTVTHDLHLRWIQPCVTASPGSLSASLTYGLTTTKVLNLTNSGLSIGTFKITPHTQGFIPMRPAPAKVTIGDLKFARSTDPAKTPYGQAKLPSKPADSVTITQSSSQVITPANSVACGNTSLGYTADNSYFRVFDLASFGITGAFNVTSVDFGIESATGPSQPIQVNLYTLTGSTLTWANLNPIGSASGVLSAQALTYFSVPVTGSAPAGSKLVVEIYSPDGSATANAFYFGSNVAAETGPSYLAAASCGVTEPTTTAAIGFPDMHIVMNVTGTTGGGGGGSASYPWLATQPVTGTLPVAGTTPIDVLFDSTKVPQPGTYLGYLLIATNTPVYTAITVPVTMTATVAAGWGKLLGTVQDLGYCDIHPAPLADAKITIQGTGGFTATTMTAADGSYQYWMPIGVAPLTVTADGGASYQAKTASNVPLGATPTTQNFSLRRYEPCVSTAPTSYNVTIVRGNTLTSSLTLNNQGALGTGFEFAEINGGFVPGMIQPVPRRIQVKPPSAGSKSPLSRPGTLQYYPSGFRPAAPAATLINDGSFEGTAWTEVDNTGCTPWIGDWTSILGITAYDGLKYFWAGGFCGAANSNSAAQNITLPANAHFLTFWYQALRSDPDDVTNGAAYVKINGTTVWSLSMVLANNTSAWTRVSVDVSAYAGQTVELKFGADQAGTGVGNVTFDYVEVTSGGFIDSVPWLSETPITGTLPSDSSKNASLFFDTTGLATGVYSATLNVKSIDPQKPVLPIPVTMNVILPTYAVTVDSNQQIVVGDRGTWVTHVVTVTNTGNDPFGDKIDFSFSGNGWMTNVSPASAILMPNKSTTAVVNVFIPASVLPAAMDEVSFHATSTANPAAAAQMTMTTVARSNAPLLTPPTEAKNGTPGHTVTYTLTLVNPSTVTDTFTLATSGNAWLTNLSQTVVTLGAGQSKAIVVTVTIPYSPSYPDGAVDTATIRAASLDPTKYTQATLTTTLHWIYVYLPVTIKAPRLIIPTGPSLPRR